MTIESCEICPRKCRAFRDEISGNGFCKMPSEPSVCRAALHFGEEPPISGKNGSGAIFFCGCVLKCKYCQNIDISREYKGKRISADGLCDIMKELEAKGAENINLVTPTQFSHTVISALKSYKPKIPVVYNCGGYERAETLKKLEGLIDVYLPDFKYGIPETAEKYSSAFDYPDVCAAAVREMYRQTGENIIENGVIKKGVIIRHLVLPANTENSLRVIDRIYNEFGKNACVSLMAQFTPNGRCGEKELCRRITTYEYEKVRNYMLSKGMENGFSQSRESATKKYLPQWNL